MTLTDLRKLSLEFRRLSSKFLTSTMDTADVNLSRFIKFLDCNEFIKNIIEDKINGAKVDFKECFDIGSTGWAGLNIPEDEAEEIKAELDYLRYVQAESNVWRESARYCHSSNKINDNIQSFIDKCFKPLIDYINEQISMEMIMLDETEKSSVGNTYIQHIETNNGPANQQCEGNFTTYTTVNETDAITSLIDRLITALPNLDNIEADDLEDVKDDLEVIKEQMCSKEPKKRRIQKAYEGVKHFVTEILTKATVACATSGVAQVDWQNLLEEIKEFLSKLG